MWANWVFMIFAAIAIVSSALGTHNARQMEKREAANHACCMALIAAYVGDQFAAHVLEEAAADMESVLGKHQRDVLAHRWTQDGPSVPAMWLTERAHTLREIDREV